MKVLNKTKLPSLAFCVQMLVEHAKEHQFEYILLNKDIKMELSEALAEDAFLPIIIAHVIPIAIDSGFNAQQFPFDVVEDVNALLSVRVTLKDNSHDATVVGGLYLMLDGLAELMKLSEGLNYIELNSETLTESSYV